MSVLADRSFVFIHAIEGHHQTSLESLDEGQDDEEDDVFTLDAPVEAMDEDDEDNVLDDDEDNVFEDDEV